MTSTRFRTSRRHAIALGAAAALAGPRLVTARQGVTLTFANWQWLEPGRGEAMWEAMKTFEQSHEGIALEQQAIPRADYESTMQTQIGSGGGPDLLIIPPAFMFQAGSAGALAPLDDAIPADAEDQLLPSNAGGIYEDERLGYTWEAVNWAFFWNTGILEEAGVEPPQDPEGLIAAAEAITAATGKPGFAVRHQMNELQPWWNDFSSWPVAFGGGWSSEGELTIDAPENVAAVQTLKRLYDSGAMPIGDDASTFRNRFANGEIGMMIDNASVVYTIVKDNDTVTSADIGSSALPFPVQNSSQVVNYIGVNANSEHIEEAKAFITWLFSDEGQDLAAAGVFPSTVGTDAAPPADVIDENPWIDAYRNQALHATGSPLVDGFELETPRIMDAVMTQIARVLTQNADPAEALTLAQQESESIVG